MPILHKNITASADIHNPKWFSDANNGDYAWRNEQGNLETIDELLLPAALNFVDASVAPPTSNANDIYVLSSGGSVHVDWGSVSVNDWVRYDGAAWNSITPQKSSLCYNENTDTLLSFNGLAWSAIGGGIDNVNSAEKAALSPNTGDFVYDTDLNALQRYDGSSWVTIAAGYGIISVKDSSGVPTFYSDLQTAINATTSIDSVYIHSDIQLTSVVTIPNRERLTFVMNGNRIWGDTSGGDFSLFDAVSAVGDRSLIFKGAGSIEGIGTVSVANNACVLDFSATNNITSLDLGTTKIKSVNGTVLRVIGADVTGGTIVSENASLDGGSGTFYKCDISVYESAGVNVLSVEKCRIHIEYGSWFVNNNRVFNNNILTGNTTKSGNNGVLHGYAGAEIRNNTITGLAASTRSALYIRSSGTDRFLISGNTVVNLGAGIAGEFIYGSSFYNSFYSEDETALEMGANCTYCVGNVAKTNDTNRWAIDASCNYISGNEAVILNASNGQGAIATRKLNAEVFNNNCLGANASIEHIEAFNDCYIMDNKFNSIGTGINLNGNTNLQTNAADAAGNRQIG